MASCKRKAWCHATDLADFLGRIPRKKYLRRSVDALVSALHSL